jgi:CubicO group peptidase (beta-lactamase class C family)
MPYREFVEKEIFIPTGMDRSGYFAMNRLPEGTAFGYVEDEGGWRTNIYNLPVIGASDGGAYTTIQDIEKLWDAFWGYRILSKEMVEIYAAPYVEVTSKRADKFYGHGLWILKGEGKDTEINIEGEDAGVSFYSGVIRSKDSLMTVMSNISESTWPILQAIDEIRGA